MLTLICWVFGDQNPFSVKIKQDKLVDELKNAIVAEKPNRFQGIDADDLMLWKKFIVSKERGSLQESELKIEDLLDAADEVGEHLQATPPTKHIHIIIKVPGKWDSDFVF